MTRNCKAPPTGSSASRVSTPSENCCLKWIYLRYGHRVCLDPLFCNILTQLPAPFRFPRCEQRRATNQLVLKLCLLFSYIPCKSEASREAIYQQDDADLIWPNFCPLNCSLFIIHLILSNQFSRSPVYLSLSLAPCSVWMKMYKLQVGNDKNSSFYSWSWKFHEVTLLGLNERVGNGFHSISWTDQDHCCSSAHNQTQVTGLLWQLEGIFRIYNNTRQIEYFNY